MKLSDFHYELPRKLIAQRPPENRAGARMLVLDRAARTFSDRRFLDLPEYVGPGDCVVFNNTRVLPARLYGRRARTGGAIEVLLLRPVDGPTYWEALVRPGRKMRLRDRVLFGDELEATVVSQQEGGLRTLELATSDEGLDVIDVIERIGHMPLPPYIERDDVEADRERYQTVYSCELGSAAAPTAGLHFTPEILAALEERGARRAEVTLHVGLGTFQPVRAENIDEHTMHSEIFSIEEDAARTIRSAERILAVGTTTVRTLEHAARAGRESIQPTDGETDIFIKPGHRFQAVDRMLTNFHLPESTLIMLVAAFAGKELTMEAYGHAVAEEYRFYSYGDCMLIL